MPAEPDLRAALKGTFGFDSFRPLQEEIIRDSLAGRDVFALLPTGGGKSLCFQLPAVVRNGLTIVVSPLIALMKDQVDSLTASGVEATFLNSTLGDAESRERLRNLYAGRYRLLYVAPERLMLPHFLQRLHEWNVAAFAIDEAHCISEWGHDFRPEYRQLSTLRKEFPDVPFLALTATATTRVRSDIIQQLHLRDPRIYVASFNRPNLTYRVTPRSDGYAQLRQFIGERPKEAGIVYCLTRNTTEDLASRLSADGIKALPYHAGLNDKTRAANQEKFLRDQVQVICATIAFGMGINKPNVRYVVHFDLPKNLEGYYQETGRAGRDGLASDCLLLFNPGDVVKQRFFIDQVENEQERAVAAAQLRTMVGYAELGTCRRAALLSYFGEHTTEANCGSCDNCLEPRDTFDGTVVAQKLLSCVWRAREASFTKTASFGLNHLADILLGADTERIRKWGHEKLSTYGIGREHTKQEWAAIGRELMRRGLLQQSDGQFPTVEITAEGVRVLRSREKVMLTRPMERGRSTGRDDTGRRRSRRAGEIACDEVLFETLRKLRRELAEARGVPPYVVFGDVSLRQMAREYPATEVEFSRISGVGERKMEDYAAPFMDAIIKHLREHPRQAFLD